MEKPKLKTTVDNVDALRALLEGISATEVLVGFPESSATRDGSGPTNAMLGYVHDNGAPEQNIPARPFMIPGIESVATEVTNILAALAKGHLNKGKLTADQGLTRVGLKVQAAIRKKINEGVPPPLADSTLRRRAARKGKGLGSRKGAKLELELRAAGWDPSVDFAKPLVDTGQMRNAVSFVIRKRKRG